MQQNVTFTLPYAIATGCFLYSPCQVVDHGSTQSDAGMVAMASSTVTVTKTFAGGSTFTNSGEKNVVGQFFYESV